MTVFSLCDETICLSLCLQPHSHNPQSHFLFWSVYTACQRLHFLSHLSILVSNIGSSKHFSPLLCWFSYSTNSKDWHIYLLLFIKKKAKESMRLKLWLKSWKKNIWEMESSVYCSRRKWAKLCGGEECGWRHSAWWQNYDCRRWEGQPQARVFT